MVVGGSAEVSCITADIVRLKQEQERAREERKRVANQLRNAQKKRRRLKSRARQLSNDDLLAVLLLRQDAERAGAGDAEPSAAVAAAPPAAEGEAEREDSD